MYTYLESIDEDGGICQETPIQTSHIHGELRLRCLSPSYMSYLILMREFLQCATSLGAVESLVEQRRMTNREVDARAIRFSVGLEDVEDLKNDLRQAFKTILQEEKEGKVEKRLIRL